MIINWLSTLSLNANHQVADDLVKDPRYRVCKFIYKYVLEYGHRLEHNRYVFYGKLSHYDISKIHWHQPCVGIDGDAQSRGGRADQQDQRQAGDPG